MALQLSSFPHQLRVITCRGPFACTYQSRPDGYPNYT